MTPTDWYTGLDLTVVLDELMKIVPIAIPVVLSFLGFRKGYAFLKKQIKGA